jgi:ribonuclease P protein component
MAAPVPPASARATFGRSERLRGRDAFNSLIREGHALNDVSLRLVGRFTRHSDDAPLCVAFAVPKRHVKLAVRRNRIRRQLREAFRLHKHAWNERLREAGMQVDWLFIWRSAAGPVRGEAPDRIVRAAERWLDRHLPRNGPSA